MQVVIFSVMQVVIFGFAAQPHAVFFDHLPYQRIETDPVSPAKLSMRLRCVADQNIDFSRPEIARIDLDQFLAARFIDAGLMPSLAPPRNAAADHSNGPLDELAYSMAVASRQHVIVWLWLLHDHPHALNVVAGMAPVAPRIEIANEELFLQPDLDCGDGAGKFSRNESLTTDRTFVVEQNSI